jgi:hypothetical protein
VTTYGQDDVWDFHPGKREANPPARDELFTREQLESALHEVNFWLKPESQPGHALRGTILHHLDAANDIILWIRRH